MSEAQVVDNNNVNESLEADAPAADAPVLEDATETAVEAHQDIAEGEETGEVQPTTAATSTTAALKIKTIPVSSVSPYDLVFVHSDWIEDAEKAQQVLETSNLVNSSTKILLVVPNSGNSPARAFNMVSALHRKLCTVWKIVFLRSAANKKDVSSTPVCNKTPSFDANDGFVRPSTQQIWLLAAENDEFCTPKGRVLESQELFACGTQIVLDHVSDYFGVDRMLIVGLEPPVHPEFNSLCMKQSDVIILPQRTFTMKSCKKGRILSAYLRSRPLKELKEGRVALAAIMQVPVDDAGVQAIEAVREEFLSFLPVVDSIQAHSALVEFCAQNRFKSRLARRISALHKAERETKQGSSSKRAKSDDENDALQDEEEAGDAGGAAGSTTKTSRRSSSGSNKRQKRASTSRNGIAAPSAIVPKLADFLNANFTSDEIGADASGHVARTNAVKLITSYVKRHNLQSSDAKSKFVMDDALKMLFASTTDEPVRYFELPKMMNSLFPSKASLLNVTADS